MKRKSAPLASGPSTRSLPDLASAVIWRVPQGLRHWPELATGITRPGVHLDKVSSVTRRRRRLPASGRHAMVARRKKGQGSGRTLARVFPQELGKKRARIEELAQSLHRATRMLDVFLGVTII